MLNGEAEEGEGEGSKPMLFDMKSIEAKAARWTQIVVKRYAILWLENLHLNSPSMFFFLNGNCVGLIFSCSELAFDAARFPNGKRDIPRFWHSSLEEPNQATSVRQLGGWLSGFEVLMRHVELWRENVRGKLK